MYSLRISGTAHTFLMLACAACVAGSEDSLTILASPAYLLPRLLQNPLHGRPGLRMFVAMVFDLFGRKPSLVLVVHVVLNDYLGGIVLLDGCRDTTLLSSDTIS
jgi:hypothetical protein